MSTFNEYGGMRITAEDRYQAAMERRELARAQACRCLFEMPGRCPGPENCPMCEDDEDES